MRSAGTGRRLFRAGPGDSTGPDIGRLQREGRLVTGDRLVTAEQVSEPRRGQRFAFIIDTRLCDAAFELADGADMVVCESAGLDVHLVCDNYVTHTTDQIKTWLARHRASTSTSPRPAHRG